MSERVGYLVLRMQGSVEELEAMGERVLAVAGPGYIAAFPTSQLPDDISEQEWIGVRTRLLELAYESDFRRGYEQALQLGSKVRVILEGQVNAVAGRGGPPSMVGVWFPDGGVSDGLHGWPSGYTLPVDPAALQVLDPSHRISSPILQWMPAGQRGPADVNADPARDAGRSGPEADNGPGGAE